MPIRKTDAKSENDNRLRKNESTELAGQDSIDQDVVIETKDNVLYFQADDMSSATAVATVGVMGKSLVTKFQI